MECLCVGLFLYEPMSLFGSAYVCLCVSHTLTSKNTLWLNFLAEMYALAQ
jgi:hypothetical protein